MRAASMPLSAANQGSSSGPKRGSGGITSAAATSRPAAAAAATARERALGIVVERGLRSACVEAAAAPTAGAPAVLRS